MSENPPPQTVQQEQPRGTFTRRTVRQTERGPEEQLIIDPLGHRLNAPGLPGYVDSHDEDFPGFLGRKEIAFGHIKEKERKKFYANGEAWVALRGMSNKNPSIQKVADQWLISRVLGPAQISMGVEGAAIQSENTKTSRLITKEEKKSRFSLRR